MIERRNMEERQAYRDGFAAGANYALDKLLRYLGSDAQSVWHKAAVSKTQNDISTTHYLMTAIEGDAALPTVDDQQVTP